MSRIEQDDFVIPQGTTWAARWPLATEDDSPLDTTGWTVRAHVKRNFDDKTILHEWSSALGNATVFDKYVELRITPEVSSGWKWGVPKAIYDIEITFPNGDIQRIAQGTITLSKEVTR